MRRHTLWFWIVALCGCTGGPRADAALQEMSKIPTEERPADWSHLRKLAQGEVREGVLRADDLGMELHFRRGDSTRPFLQLDYASSDADCWKEPVVDDDEVERTRESTWWIFYDADQAVALEFTAEDVGAWFWNAERECVVRRPAIGTLEVNDTTPREYYKGDDVQVGYRWNYTYQEETGPVLYENDGDQEIDLEVVEGPERLVTERDAVSILAANGRALLHQDFEWSREQPCYDSQLSIFEEPDGGLYAVISWESFGTATSCEETAGGNRYQSAIAEWRPEKRVFETTYRVDDRTRPLEPDGEAASLEVEVRHDVLGGTLALQMQSEARRHEDRVKRCAERERGTGDCLSYESCWTWESDERRITSYEFIASDGPSLPLGSGQRTESERERDCGPLYP